MEYEKKLDVILEKNAGTRVGSGANYWLRTNKLS